MGNKSALILCSIGMLLILNMLPFAVAQSDESEPPAPMTRIMMLPPEPKVTGRHVDPNGHFYTA